MSEESAHESGGELVMHRHTPSYRSEGMYYMMQKCLNFLLRTGLNKLIDKLDGRYQKDISKKQIQGISKSHMFAS